MTNKKFLRISMCVFLLFTAGVVVVQIVMNSGASTLPEDPEPTITQTPTHTPTPAPTPAEPEPTATPAPTASPTPIPEAYEITDFTVSLSDGKTPDTLLDRDYNTKMTLAGDVTVEIAADEEIHSLYMIWDLTPGLWSVTSSSAQSFGADGFIHEFAVLSTPGKTLTVTLPEDGAVLCDVYVFSEGTPPDFVQTWAPPHEKADILLLPTHADDEHLFFTGIMPYYAGELGYRVQVAYMTNHWNSPPRPHELLNGLWTVGIRNYPVISEFNDRFCEDLAHAESIYGFDNIVDFHVEQLRRFKPSVVVGHDLNGEYGHGGHMLNARALVEAVGYAANSEYHGASNRLYGVWDTPKLYLHLYGENEIVMDWDIPLENFDGATAREMATRGYACHLSQHHWQFRVPQSASSGRAGHAFGLVRSTVGEDVIGGDLLENIR